MAGGGALRFRGRAKDVAKSLLASSIALESMLKVQDALGAALSPVVAILFAFAILVFVVVDPSAAGIRHKLVERLNSFPLSLSRSRLQTQLLLAVLLLEVLLRSASATLAILAICFFLLFSSTAAGLRDQVTVLGKKLFECIPNMATTKHWARQALFFALLLDCLTRSPPHVLAPLLLAVAALLLATHRGVQDGLVRAGSQLLSRHTTTAQARKRRALPKAPSRRGCGKALLGGYLLDSIAATQSWQTLGYILAALLLVSTTALTQQHHQSLLWKPLRCIFAHSLRCLRGFRAAPQKSQLRTWLALATLLQSLLSMPLLLAAAASLFAAAVVFVARRRSTTSRTQSNNNITRSILRFLSSEGQKFVEEEEEEKKRAWRLPQKLATLGFFDRQRAYAHDDGLPSFDEDEEGWFSLLSSACLRARTFMMTVSLLCLHSVLRLLSLAAAACVLGLFRVRAALLTSNNHDDRHMSLREDRTPESSKSSTATLASAASQVPCYRDHGRGRSPTASRRQQQQQQQQQPLLDNTSVLRCSRHGRNSTPERRTRVESASGRRSTSQKKAQIAEYPASSSSRSGRMLPTVFSTAASIASALQSWLFGVLAALELGLRGPPTGKHATSNTNHNSYNNSNSSSSEGSHCHGETTKTTSQTSKLFGPKPDLNALYDTISELALAFQQKLRCSDEF